MGARDIWNAVPMRVASLRLRLLAGVVDAGLLIGGGIATIGLTIASFAAYERVRGSDGHDTEGDPEASSPRFPREYPQSRQFQAALWGASAGLAIATRGWRSPGLRVVGLRRVDARTGGIVSVRSALTGVFYDQAWQAVTNSLFGSRARRERDRLISLGPQIKAIEREHASDPETGHRATMKLYRDSGVTPFGGCGLLLAGPILSQATLALRTRGGRTVRDRVTGTSVVIDR
jgi:hypothetical protein